MNPLGEVMFRVGDGFVLIDRTEPREDELYDLGSDWRDVASEHPDRVARLQTQLAEFRRLRHAGPSLEAKPPPNLDEVQPALREQLRTLGYVE